MGRRDKENLEKAGRDLILWGRNALEEALKAGRTIERVYLQYGRYFEPEFIEKLQKRGIRLQWSKKDQLEKLAKTKKHQGVVILISPINYVSPYRLLKEVMDTNGFFLVLDRITEPQNLGSIARSVEFFGGLGILLPERESAPINELAVKSSSGALLHLRVARTPSLKETLQEFKSMEGHVYAIETGGEDIKSIEFQRPLALVVGSEGRGVAREILELCDRIATIRGRGKVPSLNVAVAAAIAMWQVYNLS